ncbi:MAG TPA: nucleotidyltransferase domain-containing protein, partial [Anaerolineales bacterium]|nr:nucleotidyltransferase domain-containing protein [Anaerolineales bacterium]
MNPNLQDYLQSRNVLITSIVTELSSDERLLAAWLTGSYGRNDADEVSDLDLNIVVAEPYTKILCARQEQVSHKTTSARLELFSRFGQPAIIHENNHNAPENGTFTF